MVHAVYYLLDPNSFDFSPPPLPLLFLPSPSSVSSFVFFSSFNALISGNLELSNNLLKDALINQEEMYNFSVASSYYTSPLKTWLTYSTSMYVLETTNPKHQKQMPTKT